MLLFAKHRHIKRMSLERFIKRSKRRTNCGFGEGIYYTLYTLYTI